MARGRGDRHRRLLDATRRSSCGSPWLVLLVCARAIARMIALRVAPTERCLFIGDEASAETVRAKLTGRRGVKATSSRSSTSTRPRPWSTDALLRAAAHGDPRPGPDAGRAPRDRRARQRGRRRDAQPGAHAEGGGRARQRAAAPARGGRLLGRVRRPARRHRDGRPPLRTDALLERRQARLRPARSARSACWRSRR